jgi:hypothetical protein
MAGKRVILSLCLKLFVVSIANVIFFHPGIANAEKIKDSNSYVISAKVFYDKMKAGWLGQVAGVTMGAPTEFTYMGEIIPEDKLPVWKDSMVNEAFGQDDLYVEMTFLKTLEIYGLDVSIRQIGIDFANTEFGLCHANDKGRWNLRKGIAPPDCSHPKYNEHADDIDYQIISDFSGLISPGMPQYPVEAGEKFGRLVCYGDGMYGGQFVGAMYSYAFFETDIEKIVKNALECIPDKSQYYECISDVIKGFKENPDDWKKTWESINTKYHKDISYRQFSCTVANNFNIDAKINGAYIAIGLLYGRGDIEKTIKISTMCGQDSDCNPSSAAGIVATVVGFDQLPTKYKNINNKEKFLYTDYNFPELINVSKQLAEKLVVRNGGKVEKSADGDLWGIPKKNIRPAAPEQSANPNPPVGSMFTSEEMAKIKYHNPEKLPPELAIHNFAPGWRVINCGDYMQPGLYDEWGGHKTVFVTHPYSQSVPCTIERDYAVPSGCKTRLHIIVGHYYMGDFEFIVKVNAKEMLHETLGPNTFEDNFVERNLDLSSYAGNTVKIELLNQPTGWACESAYWDVIEIVHDN